MDEEVKTAWSQVENQYQRRVDLIPNLVNTVKGFAAQEQAVFLGVTEARAKASQTTVNIDDPASFEAFQAAQGELSSALSRLLVTVENYPELKSDKNFLELQAQLEGTENRISTERMRFNEVVKTYNVAIRSFPTNIIAGVFGFMQKQLFEAQEWAEKAPVVDFAK
jgi:LemA protein